MQLHNAVTISWPQQSGSQLLAAHLDRGEVLQLGADACQLPFPPVNLCPHSLCLPVQVLPAEAVSTACCRIPPGQLQLAVSWQVQAGAAWRPGQVDHVRTSILSYCVSHSCRGTSTSRSMRMSCRPLHVS